MHTHTAPRPLSPDPKAARIAALSEEYLTASEVRKEEIGEEIVGLANGKIGVLR